MNRLFASSRETQAHTPPSEAPSSSSKNEPGDHAISRRKPDQEHEVVKAKRKGAIAPAECGGRSTSGWFNKRYP